MVRVSIRTSWVVNFALFCCYRPVIYTRPVDMVTIVTMVVDMVVEFNIKYSLDT